MSAEEPRASSPGGPEPQQQLETGTISSYEAVAGIIIGSYRLLQPIGQGGMGEVWLVEQMQPVRRRIAIKLIKVGMDTREVVARFESERQALALMDHPTIAKVFDAGSTPQGRPYFVMEYVSGIPITEYCDRHKLTPHERLELFIHVCEGVQHAHQKAIIHRDLKPSNILITELDGNPLPKIIDFGVAKATSQRLTAETIFTRLGTVVGTPGYMSPEQADPTGVDIDTRTDVYSLGVLLYELLVGALPLDFQKLAFDEILRHLREEDAVRPSTRLRSLGQQSTAMAQNRGVDYPTLIRQLRGDLDAITLKALEKSRSRRYAAASELAADIRRYLRNEPVTAHAATPIYQLSKYIRRHRIGVAAAAGLAVMLISFTAAQTFQLRRTTSERDRANRERDRANRITEFMAGMFKMSDPSEARGRTITAREILDNAMRDIGHGLGKDPELQAKLMDTMARTYVNLGLYSRGDDLARRALDSRLNLFGPDDPKTLESMTRLGWILHFERHDAEAENLERQALVGETRILGRENLLTLQTMDHLAVILEDQGRYREDETLEREVIEIASRTLGSGSEQTLFSMNNLGSTLWKQGRYAEAERQYRQLLDIQRRVWGQDHPDTLGTMHNLALAIKSQGRLPDAEKLYREVWAANIRVQGAEHPATATTMESLASVLSDEGRKGDAEKLYRETLAIRLRTLGPEHPDTLLAKYNTADVLFKEGHVHEAETLQRETLRAQTHSLGSDNPDTLASESNLARTLIKEGRYAEAEKIAREAFDIQLRTLGPHNPDTVNTLQQLGTAMAYGHRYPEATKLFRDMIERETNSEEQHDQFTVWYSFACVALAAGRPDDAVQYLREAIKRGYDVDGLMADDELKELRRNPDFRNLVAEFKRVQSR